jgi:hypothetical protein
VIDRCPPIIVDQTTGTIIDGAHRVLAARQLGRHRIAAHLFTGSRQEALVMAIHSNVSHGMPLSLAEREAAAQMVLCTYPDWSDRRIGEVCGISGKTVGSLRNRATAELTHMNGRLGRDGRRRPTNSEERRREITALLTRNPEVSIRQIARTVDVSPTTVMNIRRRIESARNGAEGSGSTQPDGRDSAAAQPSGRDQCFTSWTSDPAILSMNEGPRFAEWLEGHRIADREWVDYVDHIPLSRLFQLNEYAQQQSEGWTRLAHALEIAARSRLS